MFRFGWIGLLAVFSGMGLCVLLREARAQGDEDALLTWKAKGFEIVYDDQLAEYRLSSQRGELGTYGRHEYRRLLSDLKSVYKVRDQELLDSIAQHTLVRRVSRPTSEELLQQSFLTLDLSKRLLTGGSSRCSSEPSEIVGPSQYSVSLSSAAEKRLSHQLIEEKMERDGYFPLGKLLKTKVELLTSNDNPLHGLAYKAGLTRYKEGIEGDDRGKTLTVQNDVNFQFEGGQVTLRTSAQGFSRLSSMASEVSINGKVHQTYFKKDSKGQYYQEFLSVDGHEVQVRKELGFKDIYVKVNVRQETLGDSRGAAAVLQREWHKAVDIPLKYQNIENIKTQTRHEVGLTVGKDFVIHETPQTVYRSDWSGGAIGATQADFNSLTSGVDFKVQRRRPGDPQNLHPKFEARVYANARAYQDKEVDRSVGAQITSRMKVTREGFVYVTGGVASENDRFSREYGREERSERGRYDLQHYLGMGFETAF
ncbi:MAG: hypothetical protein RJB38_1185 [Pseudomonadota bacterium]|jgi:hypothetical protein